ncbi:MAG: hypothetical protein EOO38_27800, partial [Cytophagaceae bacterium]
MELAREPRKLFVDPDAAVLHPSQLNLQLVGVVEQLGIILGEGSTGLLKLRELRKALLELGALLLRTARVGDQNFNLLRLFLGRLDAVSAPYIKKNMRMSTYRECLRVLSSPDLDV